MPGQYERMAVGDRTIEYAWVGPERTGGDDIVLVFLHQGLGCIELWRGYPAVLAEAAGLPGFVYSRFGYGGSDPCELPRPLDYMEREGTEVLPQVLAAAGIGRHILIGHSDGGSISIAYAGGTPAAGLLGAVLEAPHVFTEQINVDAVAATRREYDHGKLKRAFEKYHGANADCAVHGWSGAWTDPGFADWNMDRYLASIRVPLLVIQGADDQYGTAAQPDTIARLTGGPCEVLMLAECAHAPHEEQPEAVLQAMLRFVGEIAGRR
jgi:pimeloyl-ACP methyl ester carboxylesterase